MSDANLLGRRAEGGIIRKGVLDVQCEVNRASHKASYRFNIYLRSLKGCAAAAAVAAVPLLLAESIFVEAESREAKQILNSSFRRTGGKAARKIKFENGTG